MQHTILYSVNVLGVFFVVGILEYFKVNYIVLWKYFSGRFDFALCGSLELLHLLVSPVMGSVCLLLLMPLTNQTFYSIIHFI